VQQAKNIFSYVLGNPANKPFRFTYGIGVLIAKKV